MSFSVLHDFLHDDCVCVRGKLKIHFRGADTAATTATAFVDVMKTNTGREFVVADFVMHNSFSVIRVCLIQ